MMSRNFWGFIRRPLGLIALYLVIGVIALGANPFKGETVGPFDLLASYSGWEVEGIPAVPRHGQRSDVLDSFLPMWINAREQIRDGQLPLWNPLRAGGSPSMTDPTRMMLTPAFAIFAATPDMAWGYYFANLLNLVIAGLGMHMLVRRYCGFTACLFAGLSYMLCGFIAGWFFWHHTASAIWIPWVLYAVDIYVSREQRWRMLPIAVFTALMFLGGFPIVVAMGMGAGLVWAVFKNMEHGMRNFIPNTAGVGIAMALGIGLVAIPFFTLKDILDSLDLSYRPFGTPLNLKKGLKLLTWPWALDNPQVESSFYVGMLALVFAGAGTAVTAFGRRKSNAMAWSGIFFVLFGGGLAFGVLPKQIGGMLPILSSNPWNRFSLLLDIGLVILAAAGVQWLIGQVRPRALVGPAGLLLVLVQGADLGNQFRKFNGPTDARLFYHVNPAIRDLRATIKPFQYVGQDSSGYIFGGTLGAVGLGEWHAHALRTVAMRQFLDAMEPGAMKTATSSRLRLDRYRWKSPLLDAAGLCYALGSSNWRPLEVLWNVTGPIHKALPPLTSRYEQSMDLSVRTELSGLAVRFATYGRRDLDGEVKLSIADQAGKMLTGWIVREASDIRDNEMYMFALAEPLWLDPGTYWIRLEYAPGPKGLKLTAWRIPDAKGMVVANGKEFDGAIEHAIYGNGQLGLEILESTGRDMYARNSGCAEGAYFTPSLDTGIPQVINGRVALGNYQPSRFNLSVRPGPAGYVVVPMQYRNGWTVRTDGKPASITKVFGVMPAVRIPANARSIEFRYHPPRYLLGAAISLLSVSLLFGLYAWFRRCRRPDGQA